METNRISFSSRFALTWWRRRTALWWSGWWLSTGFRLRIRLGLSLLLLDSILDSLLVLRRQLSEDARDQGLVLVVVLHLVARRWRGAGWSSVIGHAAPARKKQNGIRIAEWTPSITPRHPNSAVLCGLFKQ